MARIMVVRMFWVYWRLGNFLFNKQLKAAGNECPFRLEVEFGWEVGSFSSSRQHLTKCYTYLDLELALVNTVMNLIIGFCILLRVILTVNNNTFCFTTIDKVFIK
jgi:hypothetical protein